MIININGELLLKEEAKVSVMNRGFLYGDGVFETVRVKNGFIIEFEEHIDRLYRSAGLVFMDLEKNLSRQYLSGEIRETLKANGLENVLIRVTVTRGDIDETGDLGKDQSEPTLVIIPRPFEGYSDDEYIRGRKAVTVSIRRNHPRSLDPRIKSCNYLNNILARIEAANRGADEGIMLNLEEEVCEGTTSNIFWYEDGVVFTSSLETGILDGITRKRVIEIARHEKYEVREIRAVLDEIYEAEELFITNTSAGVMPITYFDGRRMGAGVRGETARHLLEAFNRYYEERISDK